MKPARTALLLFAAAWMLAACASNPANRYEAPPDDGSVSANSADVVDNPGMPDNGPRK
jgi:starvation-inducible outer membrane lipoprotein